VDSVPPSGRRSCVLDASAAEKVTVYLEQFPATEKFGIGIGYRTGLQNRVLAYIWPCQEARSGVFCQIKIEDLGLIVPFIVELREQLHMEVPIGVSAWVHTHPNLGLFLSGTDRATFANWADVDPAMLALVIDVFRREGPMCKAFTPDFHETVVTEDERFPVTYKPLFDGLLTSLPHFMKAKGRPLDAVVTPFGVWAAGEDEPPAPANDSGATDSSA